MRGCLYLLIPAGVVLLFFVVIPFSLIATLFWAADGDWRFEGQGFRHWLFVKGSRLEQLGFVAPTDAPAKYSIGLQEGNFPGWSIVQYDSTAQPLAVAERYAQRCRDLKLAVIDGPRPEPKEGVDVGRVTCEIEKYLDIEVYAERKEGDTATEVNVRVWGSE